MQYEIGVVLVINYPRLQHHRINYINELLEQLEGCQDVSGIIFATREVISEFIEIL